MLTALVAVPAVVGLCLELPPLGFHFLIGLLLVVAWFEAYGLVKNRLEIYGFWSLGTGVASWAAAVWGTATSLAGTLTLGLMTIWMVGVLHSREPRAKNMGGPFGQFLTVVISAWLFLYIFGAGLHLIWIRKDFVWGRELVWWLLCIVWASDSAAYFTGTWLGKHSLFGAVSRLKTIEGLVGALLVPPLIVSGLRLWTPWFQLPLGVLLGLTVVVAMAAQAGDVAESLLKRFGEAKDSGGWIPGHGGLLDKMDSFLFAAPAMYYYIKIWGG